MTTQHMINGETAVAQLLDALVRGRTVTLDPIELENGAESIERLIETIHDAARRCSVGVEIKQMEGGGLCLSLHRP